MSADITTPRPFPEDRDGQINWYQNEIQRWRLMADAEPTQTGPLNGPILPEDQIIQAPPSKEEIIERLSASLDALLQSE
jgi:hypothetical protein